ncbi:hypothetical protein E4634_17685 [Mangrovimicrobium sediminis]|uniref:Uncharacterized protein n=1 Tax=Mangrovimicrobium sediminis TaxID=2562682 RepID=A0A4Z0LXC5_9GAMM|nr:hypothetical protein [Haliea sp. SAOS-164]TGD71939.1 hypothetical protein E4634_17685 [Haliea sp. SAOS-164]
MQPLYNIFFAGEVLEGHEKAEVRARLAKLFNAGEATLEKLFSGKPQLVKRECDKPTALKYKQAMERAGARPVIKAVPASQAADAAQPAPRPAAAVGAQQQPAAQKKLSMAERIAALAEAPDITISKPEPETPPAPEVDPETGLSLAPAGTHLLSAEERQQAVVAEVEVDISDLATEGDYGRLSSEPPPAPPAPDTSHMDMGAVGETIPTLPSNVTPITPDTSAIDLSPAGTDFSDCSSVDEEFPELDLTHMAVAPEGSDVLEAQYRRRHDEAAPNTDHLSVQR